MPRQAAISKRTTVRLDKDTENMVADLATGGYGELTDLIRQSIAKEHKIKQGNAIYLTLSDEVKNQLAFISANNDGKTPQQVLEKVIWNEFNALRDKRSQRDMTSQVRELIEAFMLHSGVPRETIAETVKRANELVRGTGRKEGGEGK